MCNIRPCKYGNDNNGYGCGHLALCDTTLDCTADARAVIVASAITEMDMKPTGAGKAVEMEKATDGSVRDGWTHADVDASIGTGADANAAEKSPLLSSLPTQSDRLSDTGR